MNKTESERAYRQIKDRILSITMSPGTAIREGALSQELQIGRTPIREALKRLEAEHLVVALPHRGMHVADISITDLTEIYEVRIELESLSAALAAERMRPDQLARMRALAEDYRAMAQADLRSLFSVDRSFHMALARGAHNRFLEWEIARYYDLSQRVWNMALRYVDAQDIDVAAHLDLLEAVEVGDPKRAEEGMRLHIESFHRTIKQWL
ncbi:MAG: GntR family transcriptional regulator [Anaerolineales bacterium]